MGLDAYDAKRRFERTPEPPGEAGASEGELRFVVHAHDATRRHHDLRLELGGVLKSWSVPKGPSLDPEVRRLAIETEDHPLDYADFEGVIAEGEYGAGPVVLWDEGRWLPEGDPARGYAEGKLAFRLEGTKLGGSWRLIRTGDAVGERAGWLLIKREDEAAAPERGPSVVEALPRSVRSGRTLREVREGLPGQQAQDRLEPGEVEGARRAPLPDQLQPQLATRVSTAPAGDAWVHEIKLDGYRMLARREGAAIRLLTRGGRDWTARFPDVARAIARLPAESLLLDGELVLLDAEGRADFAALQAALSDPDAPFVYFAFDLLHCAGWDLRDAPLHARKAALRELLAAQPDDTAVRYLAHVQGRGPAFFREACALGLEGTLAKRAEATYRSGRGRAWRKLVCRAHETLAIVGFTEPGGSRPGLGALLLAAREPEGLRYAGKVGTGFAEAELRAVRERLAPLEIEAPAVDEAPAEEGVHWVRPEVRAEVAFSGWTANGRLRHASFQGLREEADMPTRPLPTLTSPERELFDGIAKRELAEAWQALAPRMLPELRGRPLSLYRCPEGARGDCFFQKHDRPGMPEALRRVDWDGESYLCVEDVAGLVGLAQVSALELHVPGVRIADLDRPDLVVFDLDPGPGVSWRELAATALTLRERLEADGLAAFLRLTGGKGVHVVSPLVPKARVDAVKAYAEGIAREFAHADPDRFTAQMAKARREGRIFIDYLRNARKATAIATWSTRARPHAPVAAPLAWSELDVDGEGVPVVTLREALERDDPWAELRDAAVALP